MTDTDQPGKDRRTELLEVVRRTPKTIPDVVSRLDEIATITGRWPPGEAANGIACFSRLYRQITKDVQEADDRREFRCGPFIRELDVAFARRYLAALDAWVTGTSPTPGCWAVLFDRSEQDEIHEWRFAAAGVNAHVNFDLAFALLDVWTAHPTPLASSDRQRDDYDMINHIFYRNMESLCEEFHAPLAKLDGRDVWERMANFVGDGLVWITREMAWGFAERMWPHHDPDDPDNTYRTAPTEFLDLMATAAAEKIL